MIPLDKYGNKGEKGEKGYKGDRGLIGLDGPDVSFSFHFKSHELYFRFTQGPRGVPGREGQKGDQGDEGDRVRHEWLSHYLKLISGKGQKR